MAETERQVEAHLDGHLRSLPDTDQRSRQIVSKMKDDEAQHRSSAERAGGVSLPAPVRGAMRAMARVMASTAYWHRSEERRVGKGGVGTWRTRGWPDH